jgi:cysteine desulfurase
MVYLDYNASTPVDQRVLPGLMDAVSEFGNPSSVQHGVGARAAELVEGARSSVASLVRRPMQDVVLTSGASEAAVLGIVGAMVGSQSRPNVVVASTEHKAIISSAEAGARLTGGTVRWAQVDTSGVVDLDHLRTLVDDSVSLVAVMAANNETGVLSPVADVAAISRRSGALAFVDATQLVGKAPLELAMASADIAVFSSHKIYGPKGAGALIANRQIQQRITPLMGGGGQERGLRGGTHNTWAIVGFGLAAHLADSDSTSDSVRIRELSDRLFSLLESRLQDIELNGAGAERLSNTLNVRFVGADAEAVMASMPNVCVSSGSACQSAAPSPSHVLLAMGLSGAEAEESVRISLGRPTTTVEIDLAGSAIVDAVSRVRELTAA